MSTNKLQKLSVYVKNARLLEDVGLLASFDDISVTDLVNKALYAYMQARNDDVMFMRRQQQNLAMFKQQSKGRK